MCMWMELFYSQALCNPQCSISRVKVKVVTRQEDLGSKARKQDRQKSLWGRGTGPGVSYIALKRISWASALLSPSDASPWCIHPLLWGVEERGGGGQQLGTDRWLANGTYQAGD